MIETMTDAEIDTLDIPEIEDWRGVERGRFYRPVKRAVTIRLDADVVAWFKSRSRKYQTAVNQALREYMIHHLKGRRLGIESGSVKRRER